RQLARGEIECVRAWRGAQGDPVAVRCGGGDVVRVGEVQLADEAVLFVDREEAGGAVRKDDGKVVRGAVRRRLPRRGAGYETRRNRRGAEVDRESRDHGGERERQRRRTEPDAARHRSAARARAPAGASAARAGSTRPGGATRAASAGT